MKMDGTNFIVVASNLAAVDQGKLTQFLCRYGRVFHASGNVEQIRQRLTTQGLIDEDESNDATLIIIPAATWDPDVAEDPEDDNNEYHVPVGRGIHETIQALQQTDGINIDSILFVGEQRDNKAEEYPERLRWRVCDNFDGDEIEDGDWKTRFALYEHDNSEYDCDDIKDNQSWSKVSKREVFDGGYCSSGSKLTLLIARAMGLI